MATKYKGVEINNGGIRIVFYYLNKRYRETLHGLAVTDKNLKFASQKREAILHDISRDRFNYSEYFPKSKHAIELSGTANKGRTVAEGIEAWLAISQIKNAGSTYRNYKCKSKHITDKWGERAICSITYSELEQFQISLVKKNLKPKTINDIFTPCRGAFSTAFSDGIIDRNPFDRLKNFKLVDTNDADPFSKDEIKRIDQQATPRQTELNGILLACWTGLSISELCGLAWEDIDLQAGTLAVKRARVEYIFKAPKELSRTREIELLAPAIEILKRLRLLTEMQAPNIVEVKGRDHITTTKESLRFVVLNSEPQSRGKPCSATNLGRFFSNHLRKAKLRHRGPNQMRHTFASTMLTAGVPTDWIYKTMGHTSETMLRKHYARLIKEDAPRMADMVNNLIDQPSKGAKNGGAKKGLKKG